MEPFEVRGVGRQVIGEQFDGHAMAHDLVLGQIDGAHAAGANVAKQLPLAEIKALMPALQQFFAVPLGQQAGLGQNRGDNPAVIDRFVDARKRLV